MSSQEKMQQVRDDNDGEFPKYAWPGGYPIYYLLGDNEPLCADCANGQNGSEATHRLTDKDGQATDSQWLIVAYEIHYEGAPISCAQCNTQIESAYGNPESEDGEGEPDEGDITTTDHKSFYQYGKLYLEATGDGEHWASELKARMDADSFWPNVFSISDHGNSCLLDLAQAISEEPARPDEDEEPEE
jgi:hypothetical protein